MNNNTPIRKYHDGQADKGSGGEFLSQETVFRELDAAYNTAIDHAIKTVVHDNSGPHPVTDEIKATKERIIKKLSKLKKT